jgi:hypothetical protein
MFSRCKSCGRVKGLDDLFVSFFIFIFAIALINHGDTLFSIVTGWALMALFVGNLIASIWLFFIKRKLRQLEERIAKKRKGEASEGV